MAERFPGDDKRRVLEATDLVRLIGEHVALKRKGREWACLCPFHDDHNPSMYVVPHKQIYHCFVCGAGGDALSFVMNFHKAGFREALQLLADRAGIQLTPPPRRGLGLTGPGGDSEGYDDQAPGVSRESLLQANRSAQEFFRAILAHADHGKAARDILTRRDVSHQMIEQFGIGAAPARWDGLLATLTHRGIDTTNFLAAGLLKQRESGGNGGGGFYDAMRNRITFPIHDALGRVIAFGGRRVDDADEPKYLNSPETLLFSKSSTLYGLPFASSAVREKNQVIVTEGYMDCIACHQAGVTNVVATLGTALTPLGARVVRRLCDQVVLLFDGDEAGQRAADRAIEVLFAEPVDVRIAVMTAAPAEPGQPTPKDPDELLKQPNGVKRFETMVAAAVEALEYRFTRMRARLTGLALAARSRAIEDEISRLAELGLGRVSPVRRHMIVRRIAALAGVPESVVADSIARQAPRAQPFAATEASSTGTPGAAGGAGPRQFKHLSPRHQVLACVLCDSTLLDQLSTEERAALLAGDQSGPMDEIASAVATMASTGQSFSVREVIAGLQDAEAIRVATIMSAAVGAETEEKPERLATTWADCLLGWRRALAEEAMPTDPLAKGLYQIQLVQKFGADRRRFPTRSL